MKGMHIIVAVYDRQLQTYMRPFVAQTAGQAIRSFSDEVNRQGSELNQHPEDYTLHRVGVWDETTGELGAASPIDQIAIASNLLTKG